MAAYSQDPTLVENAVTFTKNNTPGNAVAQLKGDRYPQCFMVGAVGDVKMRKVGGGDWTFYNAAAGIWHGVPPFDTIYETGTEPSEISIGVPFRGR
jgi:hypothetical protein